MSKVKCDYCDTVFEYDNQEKCPACHAPLINNEDLNALNKNADEMHEKVQDFIDSVTEGVTGVKVNSKNPTDHVAAIFKSFSNEITKGFEVQRIASKILSIVFLVFFILMILSFFFSFFFTIN